SRAEHEGSLREPHRPHVLRDRAGRGRKPLGRRARAATSGPSPPPMNPRAASGLQIAILIFAVVLLAAPLGAAIAGLAWWSEPQRALVERSIALLLGAAVLLAFPALRRACRAALALPIPPQRQREVALVAAAQLGTI